MTPATGTVRTARAIHRALVRLAPAHVRRAYGPEMIATFEAAAEAAATQGRLAVARLLWHEMTDILAAHRANRSAARGRGLAVGKNTEPTRRA